MKITAEKRLFWYLKEGTEMDLSRPSQLDTYVQQILTRGKMTDIQSLLSRIGTKDFVRSFERIKFFLPRPVRKFWEEWLANTVRSSERNP